MIKIVPPNNPCPSHEDLLTPFRDRAHEIETVTQCVERFEAISEAKHDNGTPFSAQELQELRKQAIFMCSATFDLSDRELCLIDWNIRHRNLDVFKHEDGT